MGGRRVGYLYHTGPNKFWRVLRIFPTDSQTMKTPIPTLRHLLDTLGELIASRGGEEEEEDMIK
jgi:hypothetical protein